VYGPPAAVAACREFLADHIDEQPLHFREVRPGDELPCGPYRLRAWEANHGSAKIRPSLLWDVTGADGTRVLYGTDTLPLAEEDLPDGRYDLVLLEETYGDGPPFGDHLGLDTFADLLAALRRRGAVHDRTRVVPVHLGHANPTGEELRRRFALLGAELHPDGTLLDLGRVDEHGRPVPPRRVLITGGTRSGKSAEAERRLRGEPQVVYAATAAKVPDDPEWEARIAAHRERRPAHWTTITPDRLAPLLREPGPPLLVDDLVFWLTRGEEDPDDLVAAFRATARQVVVVTAEVGSGVVPASAAGRTFRDELGRLNARMAGEADEVWHCVMGVACRLK
jgi:adenosylcobinamide kinase/adenosylcobinamide-phosphate guanylyltransferase